MKKLKIAYVGFGKSTNRYHIPYLLQRERFEIARVVTPTLMKNPQAQLALEAKGTVFSTGIEDIIDDETLDLVVVVTPAQTHFALAKQLLEAGKNVLLDKPAVATVAEMETLVQLASDQDLFFMPFQNRRFDSDFLTVKKVIERGYLGRLIDIQVHMDHFRPHAPQGSGAALDGAFYGHGVHLVDQMVALFGKPERVHYDIRRTRLLDSPVDDHFAVDLFYPNQFKASVHATELALVPYPKWLIQGTKGTFIKQDVDQQENDLKVGIMPGVSGFGQDSPQAYGQLTYLNQNGDRIEKTIPSERGDYGRVYDAIYETLVNGTEKVVSDAQMLQVIEILEGGFKNG
ncbi:MAG: Gfo/Idh/MocA family oxidoreductase [Streptococcaceae bacterium]|jgi:predicted dehydrogenase|nr:Gfo/Idh/MocA family oxidoreductase [Streptococcaceae bacterium]